MNLAVSGRMRRIVLRLPRHAILAVGWLRFHGWSNGYWQYDLGHWLCDHVGEHYSDFVVEQTLCLQCGAVLPYEHPGWTYTVTTWTSASTTNTTWPAEPLA